MEINFSIPREHNEGRPVDNLQFVQGYYNLYAARKSSYRSAIRGDPLKDKLEDIWRLPRALNSSAFSSTCWKARPRAAPLFFPFSPLLSFFHPPLPLFFPSSSSFFFYFRFSSWSPLEPLSRESTRAYHHGPIKSITRTCLIRVTMIRVTLFGSISLSVRVTEIRRKRVGVFLLQQRERERANFE